MKPKKCKKGEILICVNFCSLRAFAFETIQKVEAKSLRQLEGMLNSTITKSNSIVKENVLKKILVLYDKEKAFKMVKQLGKLGTVFGI
jgi:Fe-S-cluster-containing dehydrogenase component